MRKFPLPLAAAFLATATLLAACNSQPETIVAEDADDQANELATAPPVELPPAVASSKIYRCADASVVYVDFYSDNKSASLKTDKEGSPTRVTSVEPGGEMTAEGGYSISGNGDQVKIAVGGKSAQSCKS